MERTDKKKTEIQSYLRERINPILEPLTVALIKSRPENIVDFCVNWLRSFSNCSIIKIKNRFIMTLITSIPKRRTTLSRKLFSNRREEVWSREIDPLSLLKSTESSTRRQHLSHKLFQSQKRLRPEFSSS